MGDSITNPARLIVGEAAVAALAQFVPITPITVGSITTLTAAFKATFSCATSIFTSELDFMAKQSSASIINSDFNTTS